MPPLPSQPSGRRLLSALSFLHEQGYVFQVVEPNGVFLSADLGSCGLGWPMFCVREDSPVVAPDGTRNRAAVPSYAPPEFFCLLGPNPRSNTDPGPQRAVSHRPRGRHLRIGSHGLLHVISGSPPFLPAAPDMATLALAACTQEPKPLQKVTAGTDDFVQWLLDKSPADRPQRMPEAIAHLKRLRDRVS